MTDYNVLFINDYSHTSDLDKSILIGKWTRAYSQGILEHKLENYDLVFLDLETGKKMDGGAPLEISHKVSKKRFYITVLKERDEHDAWPRVLEWNAQSCFVMPVTHENIVRTLEWIGPK